MSRCAAVELKFLEPLPVWLRSSAEATSTESSSSAGGQAPRLGVTARFAPLPALRASNTDQLAQPHWVRASSLTAAVITSDGMLVVSGLCTKCF